MTDLLSSPRVRALLYGLSCALIGWALRVVLDVLLTRTGWHVGGEVLVIPAMVVCLWVGKEWRRA